MAVSLQFHGRLSLSVMFIKVIVSSVHPAAVWRQSVITYRVHANRCKLDRTSGQTWSTQREQNMICKITQNTLNIILFCQLLWSRLSCRRRVKVKTIKLLLAYKPYVLPGFAYANLHWRRIIHILHSTIALTTTYNQIESAWFNKYWFIKWRRMC